MGGGLNSSARLGVILADPRQQQVGPVLQQEPVRGAGLPHGISSPRGTWHMIAVTRQGHAPRGAA